MVRADAVLVSSLTAVPSAAIPSTRTVRWRQPPGDSYLQPVTRSPHAAVDLHTPASRCGGRRYYSTDGYTQPRESWSAMPRVSGTATSRVGRGLGNDQPCKGTRLSRKPRLDRAARVVSSLPSLPARRPERELCAPLPTARQIPPHGTAHWVCFRDALASSQTSPIRSPRPPACGSGRKERLFPTWLPRP